MEQNRQTWFAAISERLRAIIRRRVAEQVGDRPYECEAISDLTHEAFVAAAERLDEFRGTTEAELVAWVSAIAESKLCDHRRAMRRKRRDIRRTRRLRAFGEALPDGGGPPESELLRDEEREWVRGLINRLLWRQRTAIRLRYMEGLPIAAVAARLHCSETAAQGLLKRALKRLRQLAEGPESGEAASGRPIRFDEAVKGREA